MEKGESGGVNCRGRWNSFVSVPISSGDWNRETTFYPFPISPFLLPPSFLLATRFPLQNSRITSSPGRSPSGGRFPCRRRSPRGPRACRRCPREPCLPIRTAHRSRISKYRLQASRSASTTGRSTVSSHRVISSVCRPRCACLSSQSSSTNWQSRGLTGRIITTGPLPAVREKATSRSYYSISRKRLKR